MKISKYIYVLALLAITSIVLTACSDDDNGGGQPVIENIRVTDPTLADSTFTQATPGKMIVIQGRNLGGCQELYINDQKVAFNPNMNTNHSIITTIPTEEEGNFKLTALHPELASEIRVVTKGGVATYCFKVLAPVPSVERIAGRYPRKEGDKLTVYGQNFLDVERVYFTDIHPLTDAVDENGGIEVDVKDFSLSQNRYLDAKTKKYVTDSEMTLTLPVLPFTSGFLVISTPQGRSVIDYAAVPPAPVIKALSSDMPIPGTRVRILGSYFIDVECVRIGSDIVIPAHDITVEDNESELSFIMPEKPANSTTISVITPGGTTNEFKFYPYETLLIDFDDMTNVKNLGWDPDVKYPTANADAAPFCSDSKYAFYGGELTAWNYNGPQVYWETKVGSSFILPGFDIIPADTPLEKVYIKYEVYNAAAFTKSMKYTIRDKNNKDHTWDNWSSNKVQIIPEFQDQFGDQKYGEWYTAVVALSNYSDFTGLTYGDLYELGIKRFRMQLFNKTGSAENVFICVDNIRISTIETYQSEL